MVKTVRQITLILRLFVTPASLSALLILSSADMSHAINLGLVDGSYNVILDVTNAQSVPNIVGTMTVTGGNISGWRFVVDANIFPGTNIRQGVGACILAGQTQDQCASEFGPNDTHPRFFIAVAAGRRNWFYVPVAGPGGRLGSAKYIRNMASHSIA